MPDNSKEAQAIWAFIRGHVIKEIRKQTADCIRRRKMTVVSINAEDGTIGVREAYGATLYVPAGKNLGNVSVGDQVLCEFTYGLTNLRAVEKA